MGRDELWCRLVLDLCAPVRAGIGVPLLWVSNAACYIAYDCYSCSGIGGASSEERAHVIRLYESRLWIVLTSSWRRYCGAPGTISDCHHARYALYWAERRYAKHCFDAVRVIGVWWLREHQNLASLSDVLRVTLWNRWLCRE